MKRFLAFLVVLFLAIPATAQQLPFVVICMADDDKPLEVAFCDAVLAALDAHPGIREVTENDTSAVAVAMIPNYKTGVVDGVLPASITVAFIPSGFNGLSFYIAGGCDVVPAAEINDMAVQFVSYAFTRAGAWLQDLPTRMPDFRADCYEPVRLEASPP